MRQVLASADAINPPASPLSDTTVAFTTATTAALIPAAEVFSVLTPVANVLRSGPTSAFTDTWDNAANIIAALGGATVAEIGQIYRTRICNQTGFTETVMPGANETLSPSPVTIVPAACERFAFVILSTASPSITIIAG